MAVSGLRHNVLELQIEPLVYLAMCLVLSSSAFLLSCTTPDDEEDVSGESQDRGRDLSETGHPDTTPVNDAGQDPTVADAPSDVVTDRPDTTAMETQPDPTTEVRPDTTSDPQGESDLAPDTASVTVAPGGACLCDEDCQND